MDPLVEAKRKELRQICRRHGVRHLEVFGSAADDRFDPGKSDLDFLVEFDDMPPVRHADAFFGLLEELQDLFACPVDLVERKAIRNPYFLQAIERTKVVVYASA